MYSKEKYQFDLGLISRYRQEIFGITIIWIILLHGTIMDKVSFPDRYEPLFIILKHGNVGVDIFLFLSGLGLYYSFAKNSDIGIYLKKRMSRVLIPYLMIGGSYYALWDILKYESFKSFFRDVTQTNFLFGGNKLVWYIWGILFCYIIYPYLYSIVYEKDGNYKKNAGVLIALTVVFMVTLVFMMMHFYPEMCSMTEVALTRIPVFFLGVSCGRIIMQGRKVPFSVVVLSFFVVITSYPIFKGQYINGLYQRYYYCILGIALCVVFSCFFHLVKWNLMHRFFCWFGEISLELYLVHIICRNVFMKSEAYEGKVFTKYLIMLAVCVLVAKLYNIGINNLLSGPKRMAREEAAAQELMAQGSLPLPAKAQRIDWVDQLKAITFLFVIMGHTKITSNLFGYTDLPADLFKPLIYAFHMPMYFFLSGFTLNPKKLQKNTYGNYLLKIGKSLLLPYAFFNLMMFPAWVALYKVLMPKDIALLTVLRGIFVSNPMIEPMPSGALWFVTTLFIALALYVLILKCTNDIKIIQFPIMVGLALISYKTRGINVVWHFNSALAAVVFVYAGSVFRRFYNNEKVQSISKLKLFLIGCVATVPAVYVFMKCVYYNGRVSMTANTYGLNKDSIVFFYFCAFLGIMILLYWVRLLPKNRFLSFIGQHTFFYMAVHTPIIYFLYYYIPEYMENGKMLLLIILLIFIGIAPFAWLCNKICPYIEGKGYEENRLIAWGRYPVFFEMSFLPAYIIFKYFAGEAYTDSKKALIIISVSLFVILYFIISIVKYIREQKNYKKETI